MILHPLPYALNSGDPTVEAMAYAAAGVICNRGGQTSGDVGLLADWFDRADRAELLWSLPGAGDWPLDDTALAQVWQEICSRLDGPAIVRLLIVPMGPQWHLPELQLSAQSAQVLSRLALTGRDPYDDWRHLPQGYLGSVAIQSIGHSIDLYWNWPPRVLVNLPDSGIDPADARYGADNIRLENRYESYDIALHADARSSFANYGQDAGNFNVALDPGMTLSTVTDLLQRADGSRLVALVPLATRQAAPLLWHFIDNISHDAPFDVAFFNAVLQSNANPFSASGAPVLVAPASDYFRQMNNSRLHRRVDELLRDIPDIRRYAGINSVTLPFALPEFGLPEGEIGLGELQSAVERAVYGKTLAYHRESQTGRDMWGLDIATRDYRDGFGSVDEAEAAPAPEGYGAPDSAPRQQPAPAPRGEPPARSAPAPKGGGLTRAFDHIGEILGGLIASAVPRPRVVRATETPRSSPPGDTSGREPSHEPATERTRYTNIDIYSGFCFENIPPATAPLQDHQTLGAGCDYSIALTIAAERSGIAPGNKPQGIANLRVGRETIKVYAVASSGHLGGPVFNDPLQTFDWEYDQDTQPVYFRFTMPDQVAAVTPPIEIRLYSAELHLLDILEIRHEDIDGQITRRLHWTERGVVPVTPGKTSVDALAFHVNRVPGGYHVEALFSSGGDVQVEIDPRHLLSEGDLEQLLAFVREFWTDKALNLFANEKNAVSSYSYTNDVMPAMIDLGHRAWRCLFGARKAGAAGASERLGEWIANLAPGDGTVIRITAAANAESFVFPWSVLIPTDQTDAAEFWGLRYQIELTRKRGAPLAPQASETADVNLVLDDGFTRFVDHRGNLDKIFAAAPQVAHNRLETSQAILDALGTNPSADLYYFFCHGSTSRRATGFPEDILRNLEKQLKDDADDWRNQVFGLVSAGTVQARIKTDTMTLSESQLQSALPGFAPRRPIIFLNMCHSADLLPGRSDGLTRVFLDSHCAAVLGTECPMNAHFADAFAQEVLRQLIGGAPLGEALRHSRRHFHDNNNLLGFAYSLYGHADATLLTRPDPKEEITHEH